MPVTDVCLCLLSSTYGCIMLQTVTYPGVSQRDCTSYYGFLEEEGDRLSGVLEVFFAEEVCKKFPDPDCEYQGQHVGCPFVEYS